MARRCDACGKGFNMANPRKLLRGNLNPTGKKAQHPNLQTKRIDGKKYKICTSCIRTMKKNPSTISA